MRRRNFGNRDWNDPQWQEQMKEHIERRQKGRAFFGIAVAVLGILWLLKLALKLPFEWVTEWPFIMIVIGLLVGIKSGFRSIAWLILVLIGAGNLVDDYYPQFDEYLLPAGLIIGGLAMALRPKRKSCLPKGKMNNSISTDDNLNIDVTFGGRKEMITSKEFKSGNVSVTFGGCELNFMQSDIEETAILDLRVSFGGVEIIVPSHWHIQNEINPSFGNVEDERSIQTVPTSDIKKTLILRGSCSFGNVEIKSY